jgi:hypothetical protein
MSSVSEVDIGTIGDMKLRQEKTASCTTDKRTPPMASSSRTTTPHRGFGTTGRLTDEQKDMVTELMDVTGLKDVDYAREFLQAHDWQLKISVDAYHLTIISYFILQ